MPRGWQALYSMNYSMLLHSHKTELSVSTYSLDVLCYKVWMGSWNPFTRKRSRSILLNFTSWSKANNLNGTVKLSIYICNVTCRWSDMCWRKSLLRNCRSFSFIFTLSVCSRGMSRSASRRRLEIVCSSSLSGWSSQIRSKNSFMTPFLVCIVMDSGGHEGWRIGPLRILKGWNRPWIMSVWGISVVSVTWTVSSNRFSWSKSSEMLFYSQMTHNTRHKLSMIICCIRWKRCFWTC